MNVLVIEDEPKVASFIKQGLEEESVNVTVADDGNKGYALAKASDYDVIVMDVMLPHINGFDLCKMLRNDGMLTPVLMLTALNTTDEKVKGFDCGADDYLVKPFDFKELIARIKALKKRKNEIVQKAQILRVGDLTLDMDARVVKREGKRIDVTQKEYALLEYMMKNTNKVISRNDIAQHVWGVDFDTRTNVIDVYINFLRKKVDKDHKVKLIHTVIGMGYTIKEVA
ncbi:MAG: response regulator transcription factor [Bacteroidota bacterium]|jgi:DNA-binding response OmpR family regulator